MPLSADKKDLLVNIRFLLLRTVVSVLVLWAVLYSIFYDLGLDRYFVLGEDSEFNAPTSSPTTTPDVDGFQCVEENKTFCKFKITAALASIILLMPGMIEAGIVSLVFLRVSTGSYDVRKCFNTCFKVDKNDDVDLSNSQFLDKNVEKIKQMPFYKLLLGVTFIFLLFAVISWEVLVVPAVCLILLWLVQVAQQCGCQCSGVSGLLIELIGWVVIPFLRPAEYVLLAILSTVLIYNSKTAGEVVVNTTAVQVFAKLPDEFVYGMFHPTQHVKETLYKYFIPKKDANREDALMVV